MPSSSVKSKGSKKWTPFTRYRVSAVETLKGELAHTVVVKQHGFVSGNDVEVPEEQPLLEMGQTYVCYSWVIT